jgi:hypothetical protein
MNGVFHEGQPTNQIPVLCRGKAQGSNEWQYGDLSFSVTPTITRKDASFWFKYWYVISNQIEPNYTVSSFVAPDSIQLQLCRLDEKKDLFANLFNIRKSN